MKAILPLFALVFVAAVGRAAEPVCSFLTLPATVYCVSEPIPGDPPGRCSLYEVRRGDQNCVVLFSSAAEAEGFLSALPDAAAHKRSSGKLPKSFVRDASKQGARFILDPKLPAEGGAVVEAESKAQEDSPELKRLCDEDQADRVGVKGTFVYSSEIASRDAARLARVKELYLEGKIRSAADYFNAALVLQHGAQPEDYLLAHEFAIVALRKGFSGNAAWLVAASEDRFLQSIGRKQRFGTQLTFPLVVDECITDPFRAELDVPSLAEQTEQAKAFHLKEQSVPPPAPTPPAAVVPQP